MRAVLDLCLEISNNLDNKDADVGGQLGQHMHRHQGPLRTANTRKSMLQNHKKAVLLCSLITVR